MKSKNLLAHLSNLEATLDKFFYENLTAREAGTLKNYFAVFRRHLKEKIGIDRSQVRDGKQTMFLTENMEAKRAENENCGTEYPIPDHRTSLNGSCRFTTYLKENKISKRQLDYINTILRESQISALENSYFNRPVEIAYPEKAGTNNSQIITKTKRMDNSHKRVSDSINPEVLKNGGSVQIDLQAVLADCLGQVDLLEELVRLFKQNALEFIGQLKLHLQNLDFEGIRFASHKIKSGLRMMNSHELLAIAEQIEAESKTDRDLKHLNFLFNCFVNEYPEVEKAIDRQLEKLK